MADANPSPPRLGSAAIRMRRLRARRAGRQPTGYAAISRASAVAIRRRMIPPPDPYPQNLTRAIARAMHLLVTEAGEPRPDMLLAAWADAYQPPETPYDYLSRMTAQHCWGGRRTVDLAYRQPCG